MSSEVKNDNFNNDLLMRNSIITIIIILLIIYGIPSIFYGLVILFRKSKGMPTDVDGTLKIFIDKKADLNMIYNSLYRDIYLFSNFISIRKLVLCDGTNNDEYELKIEYNENVKRILQKLNEIKNFCDEEYENIKDKSDKQINISKKIREDQEHDIELLIMKESGENNRHNSTSRREWIINIFSGIFNTIKLSFNSIKFSLIFVVSIFNSFSGLIMPIVSAFLKNKVITGFLILIFIIVIVLYGLKVASSSSSSGGGSGNRGINYSLDNQRGFSPYAVYYELLDTYKYYSKIVNNINVSDYIGNTDEENNGYYGVDEEKFNIKRSKLDGKRYDNLSFFDLKKLNIDKINDGNQDIQTEQNKYYNVYLPSEKFKDNDNEDGVNNLPWNISTSSKNEKIWKLDCNNIDYIIKDGVKSSAFIADGDKCKINEVRLRDASVSDIKDDPLATMYSTEYIK
jgi:hypothetical protein